MIEAFKEFNFQPETKNVINQANVIINEYRLQGFVLTVRQLYYQFVARDLIPNTQKSYKRLGGIINKGRLAGEIRWDAIEDRTRNLERRSFWDTPAEYIMPDQMHINLWETQQYRPEVWIEKEALVGVIERICTELDVPYFACRGYTSQSEAWRAGKRFERYIENGFTPIVFHLGDHDPSGLDMTRDNRDRLGMFAWENIELKRLALNMDQVEEYNPPPNYAKESDSRFKEYAPIYGESCWELDALEPRLIESLIETAVLSIRDEDLWDEAIEKEDHMKEQLRTVQNELRDRS